jgi:hypothetical protein
MPELILLSIIREVLPVFDATDGLKPRMSFPLIAEEIYNVKRLT